MLVNDNRFEKLNAQKFGLRLQIARKEAGLSQADFQNDGISTQSDISRYEKGKLLPKDETIDKLAKYIGCDVSYLKYGDGNDGDFTFEYLPQAVSYKAIFKQSIFGEHDKDLLSKLQERLKKFNGHELMLVKKFMDSLELEQDEKKFEKYSKKVIDEYNSILNCKKDEDVLNYAEKKFGPDCENVEYARENLFGYPTFKHLLVATKLEAIKYSDEDLVEEFEKNPSITNFEENIEPEYIKRHRINDKLFKY